MSAMIVWLILILLVATIFSVSNTGTVTVMFWQWPLYTGPLALVVVGAGILGALMTYLPSLARHAHLAGRIRDLEERLGAHHTPPAVPSQTQEMDDTRRLS